MMNDYRSMTASLEPVPGFWTLSLNPRLAAPRPPRHQNSPKFQLLLKTVRRTSTATRRRTRLFCRHAVAPVKWTATEYAIDWFDLRVVLDVIRRHPHDEESSSSSTPKRFVRLGRNLEAAAYDLTAD